MALRTEPLTTLLAPYPTLYGVLGPDWVAKQDAMDPVQSPLSLARWLRMDGFEADLSTIDRVLRELRDLPGMQERRQRLRSDPFALMETLTELYFGAWLKHRGVSYELPKKGADFKVRLGDEHFIAIEVTTPRIAQWADNLFERLDVLGQRAGFSVNVNHELETLPDTSRSVEIVDAIVAESIQALGATASERMAETRHQIVQHYPEYGMRITWSPRSTPRICAQISPGATSPYIFFYRLVSVAQRKARQLPADQAGVLLLGTQHSAKEELESFEEAIRYYPSEDMPFDWSQLPNQVKYVIFYSLDLKHIEPVRAVLIINPASTLPDPPGAGAFLQNLFPLLLGSTDDSEPASR